jgi:hypothetical protein
MKALTYDYRDVIGAASLGLRGRKWLATLPGVFVGMLWWAGCGWAALLTLGLSPGLVWSVYGPVPWPSAASLGGPLSLAFWGVGAIGLCVALLLSSVAVGRVTYQQLKGNDFYGLVEAWQFAQRKWKAVVLPQVLLGIGGGLLVLLLVVLAAISGVWSPLPAILFPFGLVAALALLYLALVLGVGLTAAPAVVASSASETLETTFELFSLQSSQGKRVWWYSFLGGIVSAVYAAALAVFMSVGVLLTSWVLDMGHSGAMGKLLRASLGWAPRVAKAINGVPGVLDSVLIGAGLQQPSSHRAYLMTPPSSTVGGVIMGLLFFFLTLMVMAQFVVTFTTCQTASYVVIRQLKDEQNLLEEDLEE